MASLHCISFMLFTCFLVHLTHVCGGAAIAPNVSSCHLPVGFPSAEPVFDCCAPPATYSPRLFRPNSSSSSSTLRIRRPSHYVSHTYAEKLARAYALMRALPPEDPRSFGHQANVHCAYCNSVYNQLNSTQLFQVHESWLFLPFHRWYLYFHERILAKLLGEDDSFALTFWNYDHHNASSMPWLFDSFNETLVSFRRDPLHVGPSSFVSLANPLLGDLSTRDFQLRENDNIMYRSLIRDASTSESFFGSPLRQGELPKSSGGGTLEDNIHNIVHVWVGNKSEVGLKDMGSFYAAARDPVFYAHHAQLDRLWEVWKTISDHEELRDEDYLNSEFVFYNEDAELVRVKVGDALNTTILGYAYEEVEMSWMYATPINESSGPAELTSNYTICAEGEAVLAPCSIVLQRSALDALTGNSPWLHHRFVLTVQGDPAEGAHMDIYVNLPWADANTGSGCREFLYGLNSLTPFTAVAAGKDNVNITVRPRLYERLVDLELTGQSSIVVTLVPSFSTRAERKGLTLVHYSTEYSPPSEINYSTEYSPPSEINYVQTWDDNLHVDS